MNNQIFMLSAVSRLTAGFVIGVIVLSTLVGCAGVIAPATSVPSSDLPIVLTPSQLPQRLDEAPGTVTVIDRAMIEASGARELVEVLRLVPGFYVGSKYNNLPTVGYHGFADEFSRRLLLLVDGQRVFQYSRGVIEWNNLPLPLESVERIEVIRGPNAAVYGSNAFQGVINIQTRHPAEESGGYVRGTVGDDGVADGFFRYGGRWGDLDVSLALFRRSDEGYDGISDAQRNRGITFTGELPLGADDTLTLLAGYGRSEYDIAGGSDNDSGLPAVARQFPATDNYQTLQWRHLFTADTEFSLTLSHNRFYHGDRGYTRDDLLPGRTLRVQFDIDEERYGAEAKLTRLLSDRWRTVFGVGYQQERNRAPYYFASDETLDNEVYRLFGHGEYRASEALVFNLGAMLEHAELSADNMSFLPRLSAHYHLDDHHTLRAVYSTGSRQPTLYESQGRAIVTVDEDPSLRLYRVYATGREQGGLQPERITSVELGYLWSPSPATYLDLRFFHERLSDLTVAHYRPAPDLLTVLPDGTVLDFANEETVTVQGFEAQFDWRTEAGFRLFTSYALTDIDSDGARFDNGYEASAPRHSVGLLASQQLAHGWEASVNYDRQSGMQWSFDEPIDAYQTLAVRLAKRFRLGDYRTATAELIGTHLLEPVSDYRPDRAWERGVLFRFSTEF